MPKTGVEQWDSTASNNADIGGVDIAENCAAAGINNALRELMAQIATALSGSDTSIITGAAGTDGNLSEWNGDGDLIDSGVAAANIINSRTLTATAGSGGVYTLTAPSTITAYANGQVFLVRLNHSGGGSGATLNVDGVGAVALKKYDYSGSLIDPVAGDLRGGGVQEIAHDGTRFVLLREVELPGQPVLVHTSTASGGSSISVLDLQVARFNRWNAPIDFLLPTTDGAIPVLQFSPDLGSTWRDSAAYAYEGWSKTSTGSVTDRSSTSASGIPLAATGVGNVGNEFGISGTITIMGAGSATNRTQFAISTAYRKDNGNLETFYIQGECLNIETHNAVRAREAGGLSSGTIRWNGTVA